MTADQVGNPEHAESRWKKHTVAERLGKYSGSRDEVKDAFFNQGLANQLEECKEEYEGVA